MESEKEDVRIFRKIIFQQIWHVLSLVLVLLGSAASVQSATVSGTVYQQDGTTAITNTDIYVGAWIGDPCGIIYNTFIVGTFNKTDGTFTVNNIPAGDYYLLAHNTPNGKYLLEWWTSGGSSPKCADADRISGDAVNMSFQLSVAQAGDVNRDGDISVSDAIITLQVLTGRNENSAWSSGDVNGDSRIGIPEAIYILKVVANS